VRVATTTEILGESKNSFQGQSQGARRNIIRCTPLLVISEAVMYLYQVTQYMILIVNFCRQTD